MHLSILSRLLGAILTMLALAMGLCFIVAAIEAAQGIPSNATCAMGFSVLVTAAIGGLLLYLGRNASPDHLLRKEAIATVGLGWIVAAFFGSLPYVLCHQRLTWPQAIFESMSAFTTTGSTVITKLGDMPDSILLWRSLSQWIGGLGILALIVALLSSFGVSGKSLLGAETSMKLGDSSTSRVKDLTFLLWMVYLGLTILCWGSLIVVGLVSSVQITLFEALLYSLTTVSTGGFAPHDQSVGYFDSPAIEGVLCVFMLISSLNMILVVNVALGQFRSKAGRTEAAGLFSLILFAWLTITADLWLNHQFEGWEAVRASIFPIVSLSSSTGFGSGDYDEWPLFARCMLFMLMAVGGCSGSTAGGIKIARLILMVKIMAQEVEKTFRPKLVSAIRLDGQRVDADVQRGVLTYLVFAASLVLVSTGVISLFEPGIDDLNSAFGAVFATFFNMGPGFGSLGPTDNFAHLHDLTLLYLSLLMLLGRLEIFVVLALFSKSLWVKY